MLNSMILVLILNLYFILILVICTQIQIAILYHVATIIQINFTKIFCYLN